VKTLTAEDLAFLSLVGWCGYVDPFWRAYPHLVLLCQELEDFANAVARGEDRRLIVSIPPQHGKSQVVSRGFTSWVLGRWPHLRLILASYESSYAAQWGRYSRDVLTGFGETVFGVRIRNDSSAADHWELARPHRGVFHSGGLAAGITGNPCEICVIDDPVKGREAAESPTIRKKILDTYKNEILTRRPKGIVIVMTRWHPEDLAGWVLENEKHMNWREVRIPAIAEAGDPLGRPVGSALCPELQSLESLLNTKRTLSSYEWAGLYEQRPTPIGGGLFKKDAGARYRLSNGIYSLPGGRKHLRENFRRVFVVMDTATSEDTSADQTAIAALGVTQQRELALLDLDMKRIDGPKIAKAVVAMCEKWDCVAWIEDNATSKHLLSFLRLQGVPFRVVKPGSTDKLTRAIPASALWEQHRLLLPEQADWLPAFERQFFRFTGADGGEDDAVDCVSYGSRIMLELDRPLPFGSSSAPAPKVEDPLERMALPRPPGF
jgi:predicted phage terminase large subunit-like protein